MARAAFAAGDFTEDATLAALAERLGEGSALFYLAVPARFFGPIAEGLGRAGLLREPEGAFRRLVIEKPFGSELASARAPNARVLSVAREDQVFRIDHFLGKEPVQSILAMRFANRLFEPLWSSAHIDRVEITAAETIGVEGRGRFYEPTGALRDRVPNHLFQLLCMVAMDPPSSLDAEAIRAEKTRLLQAVRPVGPGDVVLGQHAAGKVGGRAVPGYREEADVAPGSATETYAALRLSVENWRWAGVPLLMRTGKRMTARRIEVAVHLRAAPFALFPEVPQGRDNSDRITLSVAPEQAIEIAFDVKRPGPEMALGLAATRFDFHDAFEERPNAGYEALLHDAMTDDATLFQRADTIEAAWAMVDGVLSGEGRPAPEPYAAGTDGPEAAAHLDPDGWCAPAGPETG